MQKATQINFDETLDALSDVQRRRVLVGLLEGESPIKIEDSKDGPYTAEQLIRIGHVHLPKLEGYGFISWDRERNEVTKGPTFSEIKPVLKLLNDHCDELPPDWT